MNERGIGRLIRIIIIEAVIYSILLVGYILLVLNRLDTFLTRLFEADLILYGFLSLVLIVGQAVFLDIISSFILKQLDLDHPESTPPEA